VYLKEDKHYYSVPSQYYNKEVKLVYTLSLVEVYYHNERIAIHLRNRKPYGYTTQACHMPQNHQFVSGWNTDRFLRWSKGIGDITNEFIQKLIEDKPHPEQAFKACMGVLRLEKKYGKETFELACKKAIEYGCIRYKFIENSLKNKTYMNTNEPNERFELPIHENIRGKENYQ